MENVSYIVFQFALNIFTDCDYFFLDTDTDFSESEALSSLQISAPAHKVCQSEPEDASGEWFSFLILMSFGLILWVLLSY